MLTRPARTMPAFQAAVRFTVPAFLYGAIARLSLAISMFASVACIQATSLWRVSLLAPAVIGGATALLHTRGERMRPLSRWAWPVGPLARSLLASGIGSRPGINVSGLAESAGVIGIGFYLAGPAPVHMSVSARGLFALVFVAYAWLVGIQPIIDSSWFDYRHLQSFDTRVRAGIPLAGAAAVWLMFGLAPPPPDRINPTLLVALVAAMLVMLPAAMAFDTFISIVDRSVHETALDVRAEDALLVHSRIKTGARLLVEELGRLLQPDRDDDCRQVRDLAHRHLLAVEQSRLLLQAGISDCEEVSGRTAADGWTAVVGTFSTRQHDRLSLADNAAEVLLSGSDLLLFQGAACDLCANALQAEATSVRVTITSATADDGGDRWLILVVEDDAGSDGAWIKSLSAQSSLRVLLRVLRQRSGGLQFERAGTTGARVVARWRSAQW